jgi:hypothetical protein
MRSFFGVSMVLSVFALVIAPVATADERDERWVVRPVLKDRPFIHDGLYLRMALGGGGLRWRDQASGPGTNGDVGVNAAGAAGELTLGGSPRPGLVVGGTLLAIGGSYGSMHDGSGKMSMGSNIGLAMIGATLDVYPDPRDGFHFGGTLGPAFASMSEDAHATRRWTTSMGGGVSLATGYDWWIAPQWSLGMLVRATGTRMWGSMTYDDATDTTAHERSSQRTVASFALLFTGVLH